jgi:type II secretory pathway predicted ATPase ExeA
LSEVILSSQWLNLKSESLLEYFGLTREPFNITPDPSFLYLSASHQQALVRLLYGINARKGFIVLTGEVGTGKTTLLHCLLQELKKRNTQSTLIVNTVNHSTDLLRDVCEDLGFTAFQGDRQNIHTYLKLLNQLLLESYHKGKNVTLIIDEAQNLSAKVLENIRLLSNFETSEDKLMQIVLAGQPELSNRLNMPELRQLKQRIVLYHHLKPLNFGECAEYIATRLEIAGVTRPIFTSEALEAIYSYSGGLPRLINILCDNGLLAAYSLGIRRVRAEMIREVAEERSLTIQSKEEPRLEEPRMKVAASMGVERPRPAGPVQQKIRRLGIIVDDAVAAEEPPVAQSSSEEFTVFTAGATTDEPAAGDAVEAEKERPVEPAPGNVETGERAEEVEAQFRVAPSVKEFTVFTAGAVTDEPPGLRETTEIEMERAFEVRVSENGPPADPNGRAGIEDLHRGDSRVEDSTFEKFAEFSAEGSPEFSTDTISDIVPKWFLDSLTRAFTEAMGPMAPLVLRDLVSALDEELETFPKSRAAELVESSSREILEESLKIRFQQMMFKEIETMNSGKEEK